MESNIVEKLERYFKKHKIGSYKKGSFFPMFWALGDVPNNYSFEAMTNSKIYKAPKNEVVRY